MSRDVFGIESIWEERTIRDEKAIFLGAAQVTAGRRALATVATTDVVLVGVATLCSALLGWVVQTGALPWVVSGAGSSAGLPTASFSSWGRAAFGVYMVAATVLGLVLPLTALVFWGRYAGVRAALLPYALVLVVQVLVEGIFAHIFFPNLVIVIGFVYTLLRVRQLRGARSAFAEAAQPPGLGGPLVRTVLSASLVFWSFNAVFLIAIMMPRMVRVV